MKVVRAVNEDKGTPVADHVQVADSMWSRFWGLMGRRSLPEGHGLLIKPCSSVHTAFMRFPIDVVYLDAENRVVKVVHELKPFRASVSLRRTRAALELPAGAAARVQLSPGDRLALSEGD